MGLWKQLFAATVETPENDRLVRTSCPGPSVSWWCHHQPWHRRPLGSSRIFRVLFTSKIPQEASEPGPQSAWLLSAVLQGPRDGSCYCERPARGPKAKPAFFPAPQSSDCLNLGGPGPGLFVCTMPGLSGCSTCCFDSENNHRLPPPTLFIYNQESSQHPSRLVLEPEEHLRASRPSKSNQRCFLLWTFGLNNESQLGYSLFPHFYISHHLMLRGGGGARPDSRWPPHTPREATMTDQLAPKHLFTHIYWIPVQILHFGYL